MKYIEYLTLTFLLLSPTALSTTWNDVSRLNPELVGKIVQVTDESDVVNALKTMPKGKHIVISGTKHSQGGHIVYPDAVVLDMTKFNKIKSISVEEKVLTVQSGVTWGQVQTAVNRVGLSVKVMQSSNIFSVGGSLAANIHGRDPRFGPIIETVRSIKVALSTGEIVTASRKKNSDLFFAAIGGYGLLGVILEAEIELTKNLPLIKNTKQIDIKNYAKALKKEANELALHYVRCSFVKGKNYLRECYATNFKEMDGDSVVSQLIPEKDVKRNKTLFDLSRKSHLGKEARWSLQKNLLDKPDKQSFIDRNPAMQPPVKFLNYNSTKDTDILQEYFIPLENFSKYFDSFRQLLVKHDVNLLSITLRYLKENSESYLSYSTNDMIAAVVYINIGMDKQSISSAQQWTRELVDLSLDHGGNYYLTYQRFPTVAQFKKAYPRWKDFMIAKCKYDPKEVFRSRFYDQYLRSAYLDDNQRRKRATPLCL